MAEPVYYLIVAKHTESVGWLDNISGWEKLVVEKGVHLPNIGREASSYFWAFTQLYDKLQPEDWVACCQGYPFHHVDNLEILNHQPFPPGFHLIGDRSISDGRGEPYHPNLPVRKYYELWVGGEFPGYVDFPAGAQFLVGADRILARPKDEYERMIQAVEDVKLGPWVMERLWKSYLGG